jgi:hypothetical protein
VVGDIVDRCRRRPWETVGGGVVPRASNLWWLFAPRRTESIARYPVTNYEESDETLRTVSALAPTATGMAEKMRVFGTKGHSHFVQDLDGQRGRGRKVPSAWPNERATSSPGGLKIAPRASLLQKRSELRLADPAQQPTTMLVLAASLAEGALAFVVPRAQKNGLMSRIDLARPTLWRFDDLVKGSKSGNPTVDAILDERTTQRALDLNVARQKIHAGYLIDTVPTGPIPDLRPEEAREAAQTVDAVIRKIVDWLGRHPGA